MSSLKAALGWKARGYNVVPQKAPNKKHPGVNWKEFQTRQVTDIELTNWQTMFANGLGFITGAISNVIVIETDGLAGETVLGELRAATTFPWKDPLDAVHEENRFQRETELLGDEGISDWEAFDQEMERLYATQSSSDIAA